MSDIRTCDHTKDDGSPCGAIPVKGTPYCYFHRKYYNPPALPGDRNYIAPLLESHHAIELALTHLYQAFVAKKIDMKEAQFGLQILRLASKTITAVEKTSREKCDGRRLPATGEPFRQAQQPHPSPTPQSVGTGIPARSAEPRSATAPAIPAQRDTLTAATQSPAPRRGIYDPYGCMPKNGDANS